MSIKKFVKAMILGITALAAVSSAAFAADRVKLIVGVTPFPHGDIIKAAAAQLEAEGIDIDIREFNDYVQPNIALADGSLNANFFQHIPYLENMVNEQKLDLVWVARIHIEPMGVYSNKIKSLEELQEGATIAIPNDPTNGARALRVLESAGVIKVAEGELVTAMDVTENPKGIKFSEIDAAQLPRTLDDVTASVINTNYAAEAGLNPTRDAIAIESSESPYVNVLVVRAEDAEKPEIQALVKAVNSPEVKKFIEDELAPRGIVPAF